MANFKAFCQVLSSSKNILFLKSGGAGLKINPPADENNDKKVNFLFLKLNLQEPTYKQCSSNIRAFLGQIMTLIKGFLWAGCIPRSCKFFSSFHANRSVGYGKVN